jgi:acetyl esterase/lipase
MEGNDRREIQGLQVDSDAVQGRHHEIHRRNIGTMKYEIHEDFRGVRFSVSLDRRMIPLEQLMTRALFSGSKNLPGVRSRKLRIEGFGGWTLGLEMFEPEGREGRLPCLLFFHGGAFILNASMHHRQLACEYALGAGCTVVFVEYSLAPQHPFPQAQEESYAAYCWVIGHAEELGIDPRRIGLCGDSAGGGLAAVLAQMIRDRGIAQPLFQMLFYPVLSRDIPTESKAAFTDTPLWNSVQNGKMWQLYAGHCSGKEPYLDALGHANHSHLPDAWIEVAEFDCLRDEGVLYAERLR